VLHTLSYNFAVYCIYSLLILSAFPLCALQWSFRIGFTPKEGLVLHTLSYDDGSSGRRSVAHRLSYCEMVVPTATPTSRTTARTPLTQGRTGSGRTHTR